MKATGIVRRIDDLGRIVIPKEIRRTMRIRETDPLEIYTDKEGEIVLKKYSPVGELAEFAKDYAESLSKTTGMNVCIADREQIVAAAGKEKRALLSQPVSKALGDMIHKRKGVLAMKDQREYINITEKDDMFVGQAISPIICAGDVLGAVMLLSKDAKMPLSKTHHQMTQAAADFIGKQMEA